MSHGRNQQGRVIAVTGKGGVGKTVLTALIVRHLRAHARGPILALDADPDANLATVLGIEVESSIGDLREDVLREIKNFPAGMSKESYVQAGLHQIIAETPKVDMICMGRAEGPGCYCFINNLLRKFADDLMPAYEWIVMDNEAGLEHLSRRTASRIDDLIVVVNENPLSHDCARRVDALLADLDRDVRRKHLVVNGVAPERVASVREQLIDLSLRFLGAVPHDAEVERTIWRRGSLDALGATPATEAIEDILNRMGEE